MGRRMLEGRRALVTGGSSGIGRATVMRLAAEGAAVAVNYVGDPEPAEGLAAEVASHGGHAFVVEADVSRQEAVAEMFALAARHLEAPVDLLVNNAGVQAPYRLVDMPLEEWERVLSVNLTGAFLCAREAARALTAAGVPGVIVNVSSVHEVIPWPRFGHYCASKAGLKLFGQTIARELAPERIRVATVAPGAIATPINQHLAEDDERRRKVERQTAWGRLGTADEVAGAIAWLASDEAVYVTGSTLFVDGGMTLYPGHD